jgi:signal transduction histidine kinase
MNAALITLISLLTIATAWLLRVRMKLKQKNQVISLQGKEIEKQLLELEVRSNQMSDLVQEKQQIIGVVSHDLKGPFNRIFALVQLMNLSTENLTPDQLEYLDKIHQIVADGLSMVRNLLDNRLMEDLGIELAQEKINLTNLIGSLIKNYQVLADKKSIQFHFESPSQILLTSDKLYLTRVFENLLSNALKFSRNEKNVFVSLTEDAEKILVSIRDEGPGISQADQQKLFHKMQRLSARPTGGESSTGLGLWIVKTVIDKMGGTVDCESVEGKGTTFKVTLIKDVSTGST